MKTDFFITVFIFSIISFLITNLPLFIVQFVQNIKKSKELGIIIKNIFVFLVVPFSGLFNALIISYASMSSTDSESIALLEGTLIFINIIWAMLNIIYCSILSKLIYSISLTAVLCSFLVGELAICLIPFFGVIGFICSIIILPSYFFYYFLLKNVIIGENTKKHIFFLMLIYAMGTLFLRFINGDSVEQKFFFLIPVLLVICLAVSGIVIFVLVKKLLNTYISKQTT